MKKFLRIKWENIFLMLMIPVMVIQFMKAAEGFKIASIACSITMYGGMWLVIRMMRREKLYDRN